MMKLINASWVGILSTTHIGLIYTDKTVLGGPFGCNEAAQWRVCTTRVYRILAFYLIRHMRIRQKNWPRMERIRHSTYTTTSVVRYEYTETITMFPDVLRDFGLCEVMSSLPPHMLAMTVAILNRYPMG